MEYSGDLLQRGTLISIPLRSLSVTVIMLSDTPSRRWAAALISLLPATKRAMYRPGRTLGNSNDPSGLTGASIFAITSPSKTTLAVLSAPASRRSEERRVGKD